MKFVHRIGRRYPQLAVPAGVAVFLMLVLFVVLFGETCYPYEARY